VCFLEITNAREKEGQVNILQSTLTNDFDSTMVA
jgi:hypothetical protein